MSPYGVRKFIAAFGRRPFMNHETYETTRSAASFRSSAKNTASAAPNQFLVAQCGGVQRQAAAKNLAGQLPLVAVGQHFEGSQDFLDLRAHGSGSYSNNPTKYRRLSSSCCGI